MGFKNIHAIVGLHPNQNFNKEKQAGTIRILGYNVRNFDGQLNPFDTLISKRHQILNYIANQHADIICIQDFSELYNPLVASNLNYFTNKLKYQNYFVGDNYNFLTYWNFFQIGIAIFSKYPLKNIQFIKYSGKKIPEGFIMADVTINGITRRIVTTHLQSMWLGNKETVVPEWDHSEDSLLNYRSGKFDKIEHYLPYHAVQANQLRKELDKSPYPVILSMDMNEVPSSYCYHTIKGNFNDAFLEKGFGLGTTYSSISPTLRIDYLMADPSIEILQFKCDKIFMSDHYPQVMDVKW